ncbi:mt-a70 family protein [Anaeramoeba ignava]|uniref:mRNA m(6)A methyltransferase n=1 Tax=Anaeramoeba ignava TaxID=1746090 RepID=A0A9Q0R4L5_ANAIG|nr:mt-a70 family protein [Anaeramoeba ignava]
MNYWDYLGKNFDSETPIEILEELLKESKEELKEIEEILEEDDPKLNEKATKEELEGFGVFEAPEFCVPIKCDVREFDWEKLAKEGPFDAIIADPPWRLAGPNPTRGVHIGYDTLTDNEIASIVQLLNNWGYRLETTIEWIKMGNSGRIAKGNGYYLQHSKETCLVGIKGNPKPKEYPIDVIVYPRRGQSQKPNTLYEMVEKMYPNGKYLEIFARRNNLRNFWISIGIEF